MTRLSSNWTLFLKLFVPIFWAVFFGALCIAVVVSDPEDVPFFKQSNARMILVVSYLIFFVFLFFTLMRLVRIDFDEEFVYVTNYFKTYRYPYNSLESIRKQNYSLFSLVRVRFNSKSKFGKQVYCLPIKSGLEELENMGRIEVSH